MGLRSARSCGIWPALVLTASMVREADRIRLAGVANAAAAPKPAAAMIKSAKRMNHPVLVLSKILPDDDGSRAKRMSQLPSIGRPWQEVNATVTMCCVI